MPALFLPLRGRNNGRSISQNAKIKCVSCKKKTSPEDGKAENGHSTPIFIQFILPISQGRLKVSQIIMAGW